MSSQSQPSPLNFDSPPRSVCILRLSAIGDACHAAAAVNALARAWPQTNFTWIIGRTEAKLMAACVPGIEFITFDKHDTLRELVRLRRDLSARSFDLLLHLQLSTRASPLAALVRAPVKLGFDRARARELQWLFTNRQIAPATQEHVLDSFMGFVRACGVEPGPAAWNIVLPPQSLAYARGLIPDQRPTLIVSPCSSHAARNWSAWRYATVCEHAVREHGLTVILSGGRSDEERRMGATIEAALGAQGTTRDAVINQIGKDTLPDMLALLAKASVLVTPDSGPAHMATMVGLPVVGLYAATRTARAGPYYSRQWCVDKYDEAARLEFGRSAAELPWTRKIERPGVMDLITVRDVTERLDALMASRKKTDTMAS